MTEDEIREFLVRWVMEVGSGVVVWDQECYEYSSRWYGDHGAQITDVCLREFFTYTDDVYCDNITITINQAGLDYIKGES